MTLLTLKGSVSLQSNDLQKQIGVMTTKIRLNDLLKMYKIDPSVNRDINRSRIPKVVKYIDSYDVEPGIFFPSLVCAYTGDLVKDFNTETLSLEINNYQSLLVIDGQHRIKSLEAYVNNQDFDLVKRKEIMESEFTLQLYFGLDIDDMKNLFADINSNGVKVSMSLITAYDSREIVNILTKELYEISSELQAMGVEFNKSRITRPQSKKFITSARLKKFISILLFGKETLTNKEEQLIKDKYDEMLSFLERFFSVLSNSLPGNPGDSLLFILGHEAVQKSLAKLLNESLLEDNQLNIVSGWIENVEVLRHIDWSVTNKTWYPFLIKSKENTVNECFTIDSKQSNSIYNVLSKEYGEFVY